MLDCGLTGDDARTDDVAMQVALRYYEGLVRATASRCMAACEEDFEDIAQVLRIKVWQAVRAFDPEKCRTTRDKYVFMCVRDRAKDVVKKKKRNELHIERLRDPLDLPSHRLDGTGRGGEAFDAKYLCSTRDENFAGVEDDEDLLAGLDELERDVAGMLVAGDYTQVEVAAALGVTKAEVEKAMKTMRLKLGDLRPHHDDDVVAPHHPGRRRRRAPGCCVDLTLLAA